MVRPAGRPCPRLPADRIRLRSLSAGGVHCPMRCKSWGCHKSCGPWLKSRFVKVCREEAARLGLRRFLTLTLGPEARDLGVKERFRLMSTVLARFRKRVARLPTWHDKAGRPHYRPWTAIWVREVHKDGTPHLHLLVDRFMRQDWVSTNWAACGGGPVVDIKAVDQHRVVAYITKYLAKTLGEQVTDLKDPLRGLRRYGAMGDAKLKGVYPVKRGTDPWGVEWRPEARVWWDAGLDWILVDRYEVGQVMWHVMTTWGDGAVAVRGDPEAMARLRLRAKEYAPGRFVEIEQDGALATSRMVLLAPMEPSTCAFCPRDAGHLGGHYEGASA